MSAERELAARLDSLRARIDRAAQQAGRNPADVRLVLASKTQSAGAIRAAYDAGARDFGENYVQEGMAKRAALGALAGLRWHLIGHLQTNKVKAAATTFDLIQTVDSTRLAAAIMRERRAMRVLIEVNIGSEAAKSGVAPDRAEDLLNSIREQVAIEGLMAIPPAVQSAERARPYFARLRELRDRLHAATGLALNELSMGMSDDFEAAIEEGATMVRIGRAVFGERVK